MGSLQNKIAHQWDRAHNKNKEPWARHLKYVLCLLKILKKPGGWGGEDVVSSSALSLTINLSSDISTIETWLGCFELLML